VREGGVAVNQATQEGWTPVLFAAYRGLLEIVRWLSFLSVTLPEADRGVRERPGVELALQRGVEDRTWWEALDPEVNAALSFPPGLSEIVCGYACPHC
jgi:hypothetical protein